MWGRIWEIGTSDGNSKSALRGHGGAISQGLFNGDGEAKDNTIIQHDIAM